MMIQPKPFLDKLKLRKKAYGKERRRNMNKLIMEHGTPFPKPIEYQDIDKEFEKWIGGLGMDYNGKKLPIFKLFSNQRIGEYSQTWQHLDEVGNLLLNFICITRENNPKHGENQGSSFNIPGNRKYPIAIVPTLEENGEEAFDMYSIHQPFTVDFIYKVTLVTNQYDLLNKMNQTIINEFKSLECYIAPCEHYMPMELQDISDESEYAIDDRKFYSQTYSIILKGYIIRKEDMEVTKLPSRIMMTMMGERTPSNKKATVKVEEYDEPLSCCNIREEEVERFINKKITLTINFPLCAFKTEFEIDTDLFVDEIETTNVYDFVCQINNEYVNFDEEINIYNGDTIRIEIERDDAMEDCTISFVGHSDEMVDTLNEKELLSDENPYGEELIKNV